MCFQEANLFFLPNLSHDHLTTCFMCWRLKSCRYYYYPTQHNVSTIIVCAENTIQVGHTYRMEKNKKRCVIKIYSMLSIRRSYQLASNILSNSSPDAFMLSNILFPYFRVFIIL